ncbi:hypothetical protein ACFYXX_26095 [Streptomyces sp. NPDC002458]|uniref:hypothetical protein n=1 Tax=Streptomyces sp. NPDC002458 TaxID=3364644 RepID=UPI0036CDF694
MRGIRGRTWLLLAAAGATVLALIGGTAVWFSADRDRQRSGNLEQLGRACAGLLPHERLRGFVPDDSAGVLEEYGTMLDPGRESRALLDCTLAWGPGRWEPEALVQVRAEALIAAQVAADDEGPRTVGDFPMPLPAGARGGTMADDRLNGSAVSASLRVECPSGLRGRSRPAESFRVTVDLPSAADDEYDVPDADRLLAARTAVDVANWVLGHQDCGRDPIRTSASPRQAEGPEPTELCAWADPDELGFAAEDWEFTGDARYDGRAGSCAGRTTGFGVPDGMPVVALKAESWSGEFARGAYERHTYAGTAPGQGARSPAAPDGTVAIRTAEFSPPALALWAGSVCDGGPSYHRIVVTPGISFDDEQEVTVEGQVRKRFSADARAALDRYLAADGGWPKRAHCHDTKVLGEVEEWLR